MADHSPFAVATAAVALPEAPNFAKDLYVANAARSPEGDMATIASSVDHNFKKYLTTGDPVDGYQLISVEWSDRVGATKVTISKDGKFATLTFNEALLSQRMALNAPPVPEQVPQSMPPPLNGPFVPDPPKASRGRVIQRKPGAPPLPTPEAMPPSPTLPDPPKLNLKSQEQRQAEKIEQKRQRKDDSLRTVTPPPTDENNT